MLFKITGQVVEEKSGQGLAGLIVKAYDKDLFYDDLLGYVDTDQDGNFQITYEGRDFQELFDRKPDIYLKIKSSDWQDIYSTEKNVRFEAGQVESFRVEIPEEGVNKMARLIVTAFSEDTIAAPGNRQPNYIIVSVTDINGVPVTGLGISDFKVDPMIVGPGGALVNIIDVTAGRLPSFFHINVLPIKKETWKQGVYIFAVAVEKGVHKGQTLATVLMD